MDRSFLVISIINAIREVIPVKIEHEITMQDLGHANDFFKEAVSNQAEFIALMEEIAAATQSLPVVERKKIYCCIARMYRNMIAFDDECIRILNLNHKDA